MSVEYREFAQLPARSECLYDLTQLALVLDNLARKINAEMAGDEPLLVLVVMNGGLVTAGQLLPRLNFLLELDYVHASRYGAKEQGGELAWQHEPASPLAGRRVLFIDDILDRGVTLKALVHYAEQQGAVSVHSAVLVQKQLPHPPVIEADYVGLTVPDRFVYGFGMDVQGSWRNAPGIFARPKGA